MMNKLNNGNGRVLAALVAAMLLAARPAALNAQSLFKINNAEPPNSDTVSTDGRIPTGTTGKGDATNAYDCVALKDGSLYRMWYSGVAADGKSRIYNAWSTNGLDWVKTNNVTPANSESVSTDGRIPLGTVAALGDSSHARMPWVIKDGSTFRMWYTGNNGSWRIFYASSPDGYTWTKLTNGVEAANNNTGTLGRIPLGLAGSGDSGGALWPCVIKDNGVYKMWYSGNNGSYYRIYYATSPDGLTWTKYNNSVPTSNDVTGTLGRIPLGATAARGDVTHVRTPCVIKQGMTYLMWYTGFASNSVQRIFHATSLDGLTWTKKDSTVPPASDTTSSNGRIPLGSWGQGDDTNVCSPTCVDEGRSLRFWYSGFHALTGRVYSATWLKDYPVVESTLATNAAANAITLSGNVVATGQAPTAVQVYWGTNDAGLNLAGWDHTNEFTQNAVEGPLSTNLTGVAANQGYFYRFFATNQYGYCMADPVGTFITGDITVQATDPSAAEAGLDSGTFTLSRPASTTNVAVTVNFAIDGTASNGVDYTLSATSSITLAVGVASATVTVTPITDFIAEDAETIRLTVIGGIYPIGASSNATVTLTDAPFAPMVAVGGTVTNINGYRIHTFADTGTTNLVVTTGGNVEVLIVAGGGGGGCTMGGGGGAGGVLYTNSFAVFAGTNTIVVGTGGAGGTAQGTKGSQGGNSRLGPLIAYGGGGAASWTSGAGTPGGSGGGAAGNGVNSAAAGTNGQGNAGGTAGNNGQCGAGGGGAGTVGSNSTASVAGGGGAGLACDISGALTYYAGGGGGGARDNTHTAGPGGTGGGGGGSIVVGTNGVANTGGGGGGGGYSGSTDKVGGAGGSGIVIVKYDLGAPRITNLVASNVTPASANLNGYLTSTGRTATAVSLYWGTNNGQNVAGNWQFSTNTLWPASQVPGPLTLNVAGLAPNTFYYYCFYATNTQGATWADPVQTFITGDVTVQATDPTATEAGDTGTFTVFRPDWSTNVDLMVTYTLAGTAVNGVDYSNLTGSVVIPAGATSATITVTALADALQESPETVDLTLAQGGYSTGSPSNATVTIGDQTWYVTTNGLDTNGGNSWGDAFATITNAVSHAVDGQLVLLSNGVHTISSQVSIAKAVIVRGVNGASNTIVKVAASTTNRCFLVTHAGAVLDGLTVSNGYLSGSSGAGISMSAGTVKNCTIIKNTAALGSGGGLYMTGGALLSSTVDGNRCWGHAYAAEGAGIDMWNSAFVSNCVIRNNINDPSISYDTGRGGGVLLNSANCLLADCVITNNRASSNYRPHGGGIYMTNGIVERCTILRNILSGTTWTDSGHSGGGAGVEVEGGILRNCLIAGNLMNAQGDYRDGGGVKMNGGAMANCTVVRNSAVTNYGGVYVVAGASVVNSIIADNAAAPTGTSNINTTVGVTYSCAPELTGGVGNFADPPLFSTPGSGFGTNANLGDAHLQLVSPCVDAGTAQAFSNDLEGVTRPLDGDGNGTALFDLGCYELNAGSLPFSCGFDGVPAAGLAPLTVQFTANLAGANTNIASYVWDFTNDGTPDSTGPDKRVVSFTYNAEGTYSVFLRVTNTAAEVASIVRTNYIVVSPITYVSPSGSHSAPYTSWPTAATNLQTAINSAAAGSLVLVTDGVYRVSTAVTLSKALTVRSVNGAAVTLIDGGRSARCFSIAQPSAILDGFTLCNGYAVGGAGVYMTDGTVQNCMVRNNRDDGTANGGGVWMSLGTLRNCLVVGNRAGYGTYGVGRGGGVAISGGSIENCTISRNSTGLSEGGVYRTAGAILNTVIYDNRAPSAVNINTIAGSTNSCAPELTSGVGNITGDPRFQDIGRGYGTDFVGGNFRLGIGSPCIDAGLALAASSNDLDRLARPVDGNGDATPGYDIGAYEVAQGPAEGALRCSFQAATNVGFAPFSPSFTAGVAGTNLAGITYYWDFNGDGLSETNGPGNTAATTYPTASWYTVMLTVSNNSGELAACVRTNYVQMPMDVAYVSTNGTRVPPYTSWDTAANDIYSAVEEIAGTNGPTVNVSNGTYAVTAQIVLNKGVTIRGVGGRSNTVVNAGGTTRCVIISNAGVVLDGLTVSNGYSTASGAGLYMSAAALVKNCTITKSMNSQTAGQAGGVWMSGGTLDSCMISGNRQDGHQSTGGGVYMNGGTLTNCLIIGNLMNPGQSLDTAYGAGVYLSGGAKVLNSTVVSNNSTSNHRPTGAGVYIADSASLVSHCTIQGNRALSDGNSSQQANQGGAGAYLAAGTIRNCLIVGNSYEYANAATLRAGGGVRLDGGRMENCTVVRNYNVNTNGGVYVGAGATVSNSIIYFNSAPADTNINTTVGVSYSCAPELTSGVGNLVADPLFMNAGSGFGMSASSGVYQLRPRSPCVNAGANLGWMTNAVDLTGQARILSGVVDMGAYESSGNPGTTFLFR